MELMIERYDCAMTVEVAMRDLRNHTADVLKQVEDGQEIVITRRGKPVAKLEPIHSTRRRPIPKAELIELLNTSQADPGLQEELRSMPGGTTDDLRDPYA